MRKRAPRERSTHNERREREREREKERARKGEQTLGSRALVGFVLFAVTLVSDEMSEKPETERE